ncbi:hypothetical protein GCM10018952_18350 [Streptosporangium vulgare]
MVTETRPIISRVFAAFLLLGLRKAGTPLLIASTPVRAAQPEENARRIRKAAAKEVRLDCSATISYPEVGACSSSPRTSTRKPPHATRPRTANMKA